jgi:two-component system response regulator EvgA
VTDTHPEVLLLDVGLPDMSGIDVARRLQSLPTAPTVVLVSTHDAADYADLMEGSGAAGFLPKSELSADALERLLSDGRSSG